MRVSQQPEPGSLLGLRTGAKGRAAGGDRAPQTSRLLTTLPRDRAARLPASCLGSRGTCLQPPTRRISGEGAVGAPPAPRHPAVAALLHPFPLRAAQGICSQHLSKIKAEPSFKCAACTRLPEERFFLQKKKNKKFAFKIPNMHFCSDERMRVPAFKSGPP